MYSVVNYLKINTVQDSMKIFKIPVKNIEFSEKLYVTLNLDRKFLNSEVSNIFRQMFKML